FRSTIRRSTVTGTRIFPSSCAAWKYEMRLRWLPEPSLSRRFNGLRGRPPMITIAKQPILIEDLGKHAPEDIAELLMLLDAGLVGHPDSHRPISMKSMGQNMVITSSGIRLEKMCC